ncbi:Uncharacterised protein (plasmid) [Legionella adelaidensis]|uniref:Uncharacterized protein n=1 Tax=Legionella adelaidensis TaxID=45056 RepID=A0A0W0R3T4_9GAMM|nr:hypothetical protein [Legionella adelaidensis]KTC65707.1 hypothetical protein Lade_0365 [Legionella adelaidensis]VEH85989.1 Uncharacterised protein [Legionella adelaidensis]
MTESFNSLKKWIADMAVLIEHSENPDPKHYTYFLEDPVLALNLVDLIDSLDEIKSEKEERAYYSACVFALDICVAQLQAASESANKLANKIIQQLMSHLSQAIASKKHSLSFWLPILNAFYEVHVELSEELKEAYFELANEEEFNGTEEEESAHINSIRDLIQELSDLSVFDIAENFFAQSYAMPADFFADLVLDLYSIEEGQEIALLALLHPKREVREVVLLTFEHIINDITLSSQSLTRLQTIKKWYPLEYHDQISRWIKTQRKKGVVFNPDRQVPAIRIKASEVDGTGAQGIFIHYRKNRKNRLCGLLFKQDVGIKDAWVTPVIPAKDINRYYDESFDDTVMLRTVDLPYLLMMVNHFLAVTIEVGEMPDLHLLEIEEELGLHFLPQKIDLEYFIEHIAIQISPFTQETVNQSLKRSKSWPKNKRFTESWFLENASVDKIVNRCCSFVDGVKVCRFEDAMDAVFKLQLEPQRESWAFHFLWIALWLKVKSRKNEKLWEDSFFIAYCISTGIPLKEIPIMEEICYQTVINSVETMQERKTHLNKM